MNAENASSTPAVAPRRFIPSPTADAGRWHISPLIDSLAYHWSWLPALLLMLPFGARREDYLVMYLAVLGFNFSHRHLTMPYVYLDRQVFEANKRRVTWLPLVMLGLFFLSPWMVPAWLGAFAAAAALWNIWHVYMQKYGVLRMYSAKSGVALEDRVPGWTDRLLILGWIPLYFAYLGPTYKDLIDNEFRTGQAYTRPLIAFLTTHQGWLLPATASIVVVALAAFLRAEWRATRFKNVPRLSMALGTTLLSASLLFFDPVKVYLAFAFSHALEYTVFVWAFLRKRYREPLPHNPPLQRLIKHPVFFYGSVIVGSGLVYLALKFWGKYVFAGEKPLEFLGVTTSRWILYWAIFQSMVHFYFDGFLWKMRLPALRQNL